MRMKTNWQEATYFVAMVHILGFVSIKSWIWCEQERRKLDQLKHWRFSWKFKKEVPTKWLLRSGRSNYRVWIILHSLRNWLSVGIARHYIHVSPTFLLSRRSRRRISLGPYISSVFFEIHQPVVFHDFGADENGWKNCRLSPAEITGLHLHFVSPFVPFR